MHKVCPWEAGGRTDSARPLARSSQQGFEMQSLQRVPCRQTIQFLDRTPCVPRPCAAEVISQFRNKKRQHNAYTDDAACSKSVFPAAGACATSAPTSRHETSDVESGQGAANLISKGEAGLVTLLAQVGGHSHRDRSSLPVSPEPERDVAHTQQFCVHASPSQVGEQCDGSRYVSAQSHFRGMDGKSRKLESAKGVVDTPIVAAGPRAPLRSNLDDPEEWELPCSDGESVCWDEAHRMELVACRPIIKCGTTGNTGSCPTSVVGHGYTAEKEPDTCGICGKTIRVSRNVLPQSAPFGDVEKEVRVGPLEPSEPRLFSSGYGKASEHAMISGFPVSAVGGTSGPAVTSSFFCRGHSAFAQSAQKRDKHARVIW